MRSVNWLLNWFDTVGEADFFTATNSDDPDDESAPENSYKAIVRAIAVNISAFQ